MANRLAETTSPYLLQHKDNPIDWFPWSEEAWAKAESEGKPVFLSIGYSSCHWCHVMAHESFEDPEVAVALNRDFVSIKLDREERPDVDEVYMTAVQMATGHGGWPMSLFLTPTKKPFFAGTYFPRESRGQFPGFLTIIGSLAKAWREQRSEVLKSADEFGVALSAALERTLPTDLQGLDVGVLDQAVEILHQEFDFDNGGFGGKPKFPPHAAFRFLLDYASMRDSMGGDAGDLPARAGHMALFTLEKVALGGIHDHVGGGFHRYATDERWFLPHFEKMLYDNAQLISAFHHATEASEDERLVSLFTRVIERAVDWLFREMRSEDGLFMSALDADSEGREGAYYVWTKGQIDQLVEDSAAFCKSFGVVDEGNFDEEATGQKTGENVLSLEVDEGDKWDAYLSELLKARDSRPRPGLDFKAVAAWNGLIISALSQTGYLDAAQECAKAWRLFGGTPPHMITNGVASGLAFLDDVACLADGFLDLFEASGEVEWSDAAKQLADTLEQKFLDPSGGFTYLSSEHEALFGRTKPYMDNATPSPIGTAARVMRRLGRSEPALGAVTSGLGWVQRAPRATDTLLREILWMLWNNDGKETELPGSKQAVELSARLEPRVIHEDSEGWAHTEVVVDIPEGFHINSNEPLAKWLTATSLTADEAFAEAAYPEAPTGVYSDQLRIAVRLRRRATDGAFRLVLRYQACTDSECLLPTEVSLDGEFANP